MTQASVLTRLREGDIRSVPVAVWPLLILTIAAVVLPFYVDDRTLDPQNAVWVAIAAAPLAFATAVAWVAPIDRRFLIAAVAIAVPQIIQVAGLLVRLLHVVTNVDLSATPYSTAGWAFSVVGLFLLGFALGGIRTRVGWAFVAVGVAWFVINDIQSAIYMAANPYPEDLKIPLEWLVLPFVYGLVFVGWTFVSGAAFDHGLRAIALGAGILFAIVVYGTFVLPHIISPETPNVPLLTLGSSLVSLVAWGTLIYGALIEIPRAQRAALRRAVGLPELS